MIIRNLARRVLPDWNEQIYGESDFTLICEREGVRVLDLPPTAPIICRCPGCYVVHRGFPFILLDERLRSGERLWVAYHELGHHILHTPQMHCFNDRTLKKAGYEANFVASVALMPLWLIQSKLPCELADEFGYPESLLTFRKRIYEQHKL